MTSRGYLEFALLGLLALLWGSSYALISIGLTSFPPVTLMALRVVFAAVFLLAIIRIRRLSLPRDARMWRLLFLQSILNSSGAWTLLAWGQQYVESAVASVLNSTSPVFVFLITAVLSLPRAPVLHRLAGALLGVLGIILIVGPGSLSGLGGQFLPQGAIVAGAVLYAMAAVNGRYFSELSPFVTAAGTLICAVIVLVPASLIIDRPWLLAPAPEAWAAVIVLGIVCTGIAFLIYFRLIKTLGPMGVASQAYLRSGIGVLLGVVFLSETMTLATALGIIVAIVGVILINIPNHLLRKAPA